jgi:hypothetical protein
MKFTAAAVILSLAALAYVHLTAPTPSPKPSISYCAVPGMAVAGAPYMKPCKHQIIYRKA